MTTPHRKTTKPKSMEEPKPDHHNHHELTDTTFTATADICQQLLDRYGNSAAPQHRNLCAAAAAARSIVQSESLPLTPLSYFAAAISTVADGYKTLDSDALSALTAFLAIVLPLVPEHSIGPAKAADAVALLIELVERRGEAASSASARAVVKCLGVLLGFCNLEDWSSVKLGFERLLNFSIDKRPKVRKCAQDYVVRIFKLFESSTVKKEASKLVLSLLEGYMPLAVELSASGPIDVSNDEIMSKPDHLEILHMLSLLKHIVPYLSVKFSLKVVSQLHKFMNSHFSALTRHISSVIEVIFETSKDEVLIGEAENIINSLASYISSGEKNPSDTILSAATLLKCALDKLQTAEASRWLNSLPLVFGSIAGLLTSEADIASQASDILKELIDSHIGIDFMTNNKSVDNDVKCSMESSAVKSTCATFENVLCSCDGTANDHILGVISVLFRKLGEISYFYMEGSILKLGEMMTLACRNKSDTKHLQECIGSAVIAIGPEKILELLPISPNIDDLTCSNVWLIPILRNYAVGSSLQFFMEHIVPLAESFQRTSSKVKKSVIREDLQAYAQGCWGLLPAFCRHPTDTYKSYGSLAKLLVTLLTKDSMMLENIAIALQELVKQNKSALRLNEGAGELGAPARTSDINDSSCEFESKTPYSEKIASKNIKALASCSKKLLQALIDVFFVSPPRKRAYLKDAIGCLASITDSSVIKMIFISSLEKFQLINDLEEFGKQTGRTNPLADQGRENFTSIEKDAKRCLTVELASSLVEGASEDLIASIFNFIKHTLQESDEVGQKGAYHTVSRILQEHSWFCSLHGNELMDFLLTLKPPVDITTLRSRFACFQILLVHTMKRSLDEENSKAFLVLNEIILTIKDSTEEARKAAYDMLLGLNSSLQRSSSATSDEPYRKLISMIMGYLSCSSPHIKSGAVSALSVLVHNNAEICLLMPDLVPSVLALLHTKAVEVIKAVLGFMKVLVLCQQAKDLQNFLPDIVNGVLPWSSVSRHHFREKVTVILEILMRRCGSAPVKLLAPEKHKNFIKTVLENRHGKTSSKETSATDPELEASGSSPKRKQRKRKHDELSILPEEDFKKEPEWRNRENKRVEKAGNFKDNQRTEGQPQENRRNKRRKFNRDPTASQKGGRNTDMKRTKVSQKNGVANHRPGAASKLVKRKKVVTRRQKN